MLPEIVVDTLPNLTETAAARVHQLAGAAIADKQRFSVALPGGSVARQFFPRFARMPLDWSRVEFFWGDERSVPPWDAESNYGLARRLWLDPARVPADRVHRLEADAPEPARVAARYAADLIRVLGEPPRLDMALVGVGVDGHVCSLFPGHPLLREDKRLVGFVSDAPVAPSRRLTLTLPTLASSSLVVAAAFGRSKAAAIRDALDNPTSGLPVALLLHRAERAVVFLDVEAASLLASIAPKGLAAAMFHSG
jgi:6-phosphogluconolactonase